MADESHSSPDDNLDFARDLIERQQAELRKEVIIVQGYHELQRRLQEVIDDAIDAQQRAIGRLRELQELSARLEQELTHRGEAEKS
jgi:hypothetical protein